MLQTRNGKRTAAAALKIAVDLVDEGMITEQEAVLRVEPKQLDSLLHPQFDAAALKAAAVIGKGLAASPGAACGQVVFTADEAKEAVESGKMPKVILVRLETSPEDIEGMARGAGHPDGARRHDQPRRRGGPRHGHAAACPAAARLWWITIKSASPSPARRTSEGDWISIDGSTGNIYGQAMPHRGGLYLRRFRAASWSWADAARQLEVFTNADNPRDAKQAVEFGAEGIGLCRTEHMFFEADRIKAVREMIVAKTVEARKEALGEDSAVSAGRLSRPCTRSWASVPMTIRYLDPPLHEFLPPRKRPRSWSWPKTWASAWKNLRNVIASLHEFNPMMGHRGCRLAVSYPEIAEMQTTAVINAAINVSKETRLRRLCRTS